MGTRINSSLEHIEMLADGTRESLERRRLDNRRQLLLEPVRYRVDEGPNAARKRARDTMAPLNNKTQTSTYPLIPHREFPTVVTD